MNRPMIERAASAGLRRTAPCILLAAFLVGCANLNTVWRNEEAAGKTVSLDATQRVVVSTNVKEADGKGGTKEHTRYCPEPTPDAIVAFASSLGLSASGPAKDATASADFHNALASQVASVGLRTPTTQIIRDLITANCIAHMNGALSDKQFAEAFERNQDFVLAAHAIAVIGGEPVARQFLLNSTAGAGALSDARAAYLDYQKAHAARIKAQAEYDNKRQAKATAASAATAAGEKHDAAVKAKAGDKAIKAAKAAQDEAEAALAKATSEEAAAKKALDDAEPLEKQAQATAAAAAAGQVSAGGSGKEASPASLARSSATVNLSDKAVAAITHIVTSTLLSGYSLERCLSRLVEVSKLDIGRDSKDVLIASVSKLCTTTSEAALVHAEARKQEAKKEFAKALE
ncbi:MAG: hypothetical protein HY255_11215 [Betaproteobacteria bacterium]|nr:hypothetical protein [Betaproteobacteria bacterium]